MRNLMILNLKEDYIVMAEAKGLPERQVMFSYAARNAMLPTVTGLALALGSVVGGSVLVENIFSYPGIGAEFVKAIGNLDYASIQSISMFIILATLIANFIVDLLYIVLDPRVRRA
jgi:peptide/nickel transport system permease protein